MILIQVLSMVVKTSFLDIKGSVYTHCPTGRGPHWLPSPTHQT